MSIAPDPTDSKASYWEIRTSPIHGRGLFARARIPRGRRVIQYVGRKVTKSESLRLCEENNPFVFHIDEEFDLDGGVDWNPARFINHSCSPNCEAEQDERDRIWIVACRAILPGEELSYNYGFGLEDYRDYPCQCGSIRCVGFIVAEEHHPLVLQNNVCRVEARSGRLNDPFEIQPNVPNAGSACAPSRDKCPLGPGR